MTRKHSATLETRTPIAISYTRFSTPDQRKGDSLRRQTEATEKWCQRQGIPLDDTIHDAGLSAYRGKHRSDSAALGKFLEQVKAGRVPRGSYLIIENLDRLSREEERTALRLWLDILDSGINIVQLSPETVFRHERSDMSDIIRAIIELARGHSESLQKSKRSGANWDTLRKYAREKKTRSRRSDGIATNHITRRLPGWVQEVDGRLELIPERAVVVRRIFEMATTGFGMTSIVKKLIEGKIPAFGGREKTDNGRTRKVAGDYYGCGEWRTSYVRSILKDRRAIGEYQPRDQNEKPVGEPLTNYYPPAVSQREFFAARAATDSRRNKPGRIGKNVANLFGGLMVNWRDGQSYYAATRSESSGVYRVLLNRTSIEGKSRAFTFPYAAFEAAILSQLKEIEPGEVLPKAGAEQEELKVLRGELSWLRERKVALAAELLRGDVSAVADALRQIETRETELLEKLGTAEDEAAVPLADSFETAQTLAELLANDPDPEDARLRLKATLRRVIDSIDLLVTLHGRERVAFTRVNFRRGAVRVYVIWIEPPHGNQNYHTPGRWMCRSFAMEDFKIGGRILTEPTLPDDFAERLKKYAAGENADWKCTDPKLIKDEPESPSRCGWVGTLAAGLSRCPKCGSKKIVPVTPTNVTTGVIA